MEIVDKTFELYSKKKTNNDYVIMGEDGEKIPTSSIILDLNEECKTKIGKHENIINIYSDEFIQKLNPDNININKFWKKAVKHFPYFSISGDSSCKTIKDVNTSTLSMHKNLKCIKQIDKLFLQNKFSKILEIGPGYGNIKDYIKTNYSDKNYYAIDVNPLFNYPRLFKCDGSYIPNNIPNNLDMIYSVNVFQHLTNKQRTCYYKQIYKKLKNKGKFIFSNFIETEENKDGICWCNKDNEENNYSIFFKQLIKVDKLQELKKELNKIGFLFKVLLLKENVGSFLCVKK